MYTPRRPRPLAAAVPWPARGTNAPPNSAHNSRTPIRFNKTRAASPGYVAGFTPPRRAVDEPPSAARVPLRRDAIYYCRARARRPVAPTLFAVVRPIRPFSPARAPRPSSSPPFAPPVTLVVASLRAPYILTRETIRDKRKKLARKRNARAAFVRMLLSRFVRESHFVSLPPRNRFSRVNNYD